MTNPLTNDPLVARLAAAGAEDGEFAAQTGLATDRARGEGLVDVTWATHAAPSGPLVIAGTDTGVVLVSFDDEEAAVERIGRDISPRVLRAGGELDAARRELDEYFAGAREDFEVDLDWRLTGGFRRDVLQDLVSVPFGQTVSYLDLARRAGNPGASRAVGSAMATNPLPIFVPCHRVLRTGGALGGYAGGLDVKRHLLALEGVILEV